MFYGFLPCSATQVFHQPQEKERTNAKNIPFVCLQLWIAFSATSVAPLQVFDIDAVRMAPNLAASQHELIHDMILSKCLTTAPYGRSCWLQ